ncbi:hypothetical protein D3C81_2277310 [compost metagenome]
MVRGELLEAVSKAGGVDGLGRGGRGCHESVLWLRANRAVLSHRFAFIADAGHHTSYRQNEKGIFLHASCGVG